MTRPSLPTTPAELHDQLHEMFGIGSYDEVAANGRPWHQARATEIGKLKSLLRSRRATPEQVGKAAWHARTRGLQIIHSYQLFPLIPEAAKEWNRLALADAKAATAAQAEDLAAEAIEAGEPEWAERFLRAAPPEIPALMTEWSSR